MDINCTAGLNNTEADSPVKWGQHFIAVKFQIPLNGLNDIFVINHDQNTVSVFLGERIFLAVYKIATLLTLYVHHFTLSVKQF